MLTTYTRLLQERCAMGDDRLGEVGVYTLSARAYHADPCEQPSLSASIAHRLLASSPWHAWTAHPRLNPAYEAEEREQFDVGTACHAYLLEGASGFTLIDKPDYRTKDAQLARDAARASGKVPLLTHRWAEVQAMATAARAQLAGFRDRPMPLTDGRPEETLVWREGEVWCRARLDWFHADGLTVDDYKTTSATANPEVFSRTLYQHGYDVQAAFYLRGLDAVFGANPDRQFRFVVQETFKPYALAVTALAPDALALARAKVEHALALWRTCLSTDQWPGYPTLTCYAEAPPWELTRWGERTYLAPVVDDGRPLEEQL